MKIYILTLIILMSVTNGYVFGSCDDVVTVPNGNNHDPVCYGTGTSCSGNSYKETYPDDYKCKPGSSYSDCTSQNGLSGNYFYQSYSCSPDPSIIADQSIVNFDMAALNIAKLTYAAIAGSKGGIVSKNKLDAAKLVYDTAQATLTRDQAALKTAMKSSCVSVATGGINFYSVPYTGAMGTKPCCPSN